jgi:hypothetical protein
MDIFCFVFVQKNPFSQKTIVALSKKEMIDGRRQHACVGAHQEPCGQSYENFKLEIWKLN